MKNQCFVQVCWWHYTLIVPQHCDVQLADELEYVIKWSKANKLKLNLEKTKEIVFRRSSVKRDILPLALDDIERLECVRLLGVYIDSSRRIVAPEPGGVTPKILRPYCSTRSPKPHPPRSTPPCHSNSDQPTPGPKGGEGKCARPVSQSLTVVRGQRRATTAWPSHVLPTDRQTPPAGRVAPIPRWNARPIKSSKTIDEGAARHGASARRWP